MKTLEMLVTACNKIGEASVIYDWINPECKRN